MPELSTDFIVAAPAERMWEVTGRRFDRIGDRATPIPNSATRHGLATGGSRLPLASSTSTPVTPLDARRSRGNPARRFDSRRDLSRCLLLERPSALAFQTKPGHDRSPARRWTRRIG